MTGVFSESIVSGQVIADFAGYRLYFRGGQRQRIATAECAFDFPLRPRSRISGREKTGKQYR
jgi:hypothetical protein